MKKLYSLIFVLFVCAISNSLYAQAPGTYNYFREIKLPVSGNGLTGVATPVYFDTLFSEFKWIVNGGHVEKRQGYDIEFYSKCTNRKLPHELTQYDPATGRLRAWVKMDSLDALPDNSIIVYYGNPANTGPTSSVVWDSHYRSVWHFDSTTTRDVSQYATHVSDSGSIEMVPGINGLARNLSNNPFIFTDSLRLGGEGSTKAKFIGLPNNLLQGFTDFTFEGWVYQHNIATAWERIFGFGKNTDTNMFFCPTTYDGINNPATTFRITNAGIGGERVTEFTNFGNSENPQGRWVHWAVVMNYSSTPRYMRIYKNGAVASNTNEDPTRPFPPLATMVPGKASNYIGKSNYKGYSNQYLDAAVDEFRISDVARSSRYIQSQYTTQRDMRQYGTFGPEQTTENLALGTSPVTANGLAYSDPLDICVGDRVFFEAFHPRFVSVEWSNAVSSIKDTVSFNAVTAGQFNIVVRQKNKQGCFGEPQTFVVNVAAKPAKPSISPGFGNFAPCYPNRAKLSAPAGFTNYEWTIDGVVSPNNKDTLSVGALGIHIVKLRVSDGGNCFSPDSTVTVNLMLLPSKPVLPVVVNKCGSDSVLLHVENAEPNILYRWFARSTGGLPLFTGQDFKTPVLTLDTAYYVEGKSPINACVNADGRTRVKIHIASPIPLAQIDGNPVIRCGTGTAELKVTGALPGSKYIWYSTANGNDTLQESTSATYTGAPVSSTTTYYVSIDNGSCESGRTPVTLTVKPEPAPTILPQQSVSKCFVNGEVQNFTAVHTSAGTVFTWKHGTDTQAGVESYTYTAATAGSDTIMLHEFDPAGGCSGNAQLIVSLFAQPDASIPISGPSVLCAGETGVYSINGGLGSTYTFPYPPNTEVISMAGNTITVKFANSSTYVIKGTETSSAGCGGAEHVLNVLVRASPEPKVLGAKILCPELTKDYEYSTTLNAGSNYTWEVLGSNKWTPAGNKVTVNWVSDDKVTRRVSVIESYGGGCHNGDTISVVTDSLLNMTGSPCLLSDYPVALANVITPNGDGMNEVLNIHHIKYYGNSHFQVFNRWGKAVYDKTSNELEWDGNDLPAGTYYYLLVPERAPKPVTGWVQIIK
ncbi:MAG: DUF2341 domain-containing protein [Bacteroidota bacterium]